MIDMSPMKGARRKGGLLGAPLQLRHEAGCAAPAQPGRVPGTGGSFQHAVSGDESHPGEMSAAPIVIHRLSPTGGRRVTIRGQIAGLAYEDQHVVEFLRRAGLPDGVELLDRPEWVEWRGGRAHSYVAA